MRIAVTYENGQIFQHFGHTETFKIYDVKDEIPTNCEVKQFVGIFNFHRFQYHHLYGRVKKF